MAPGSSARLGGGGAGELRAVPGIPPVGGADRALPAVSLAVGQQFRLELGRAPGAVRPAPAAVRVTAAVAAAHALHNSGKSRYVVQAPGSVVMNLVRHFSHRSTWWLGAVRIRSHDVKRPAMS